ncbi:hypothetical protein ZWY2020_028097 [Hordeum vulgare]|nr:hypothetical protein ZWY2020_028097 [Hordeum vulgare]
MAAKLDRVIAAKLDKPLDFNDNEGEDDHSGGSLDMGLALSLAQHTPQAVDTHALHLGMVTQRVTELQLQGEEDHAEMPNPLHKEYPGDCQATIST